MWTNCGSLCSGRFGCFLDIEKNKTSSLNNKQNVAGGGRAGIKMRATVRGVEGTSRRAGERGSDRRGERAGERGCGSACGIAARPRILRGATWAPIGALSKLHSMESYFLSKLADLGQTHATPRPSPPAADPDWPDRPDFKESNIVFN